MLRAVSVVVSGGGGGSITIGDEVVGGDPNLILFVDAFGNLAQDEALSFDGTTLTVTGDISYSGNLISTSDRRLKTDIVPLSDKGSMLEKLSHIHGYQYRMKGSELDQIGVMAQELETVFPELVSEGATGTKFINQMGLIAPVIEAIKELQSRIEILENK